MTDKFDVVVIGAGPAGSSTSTILARAGYKVAMIDKCRFPRDKLCGGGLSGRSRSVYRDIFDGDLDNVIEYHSRGVAFYQHGQYLNRLDDYKSFDFVYRQVFDYHLARQAEQAGACFKQGFNISSIDAAQNCIRSREGEVLRADYLVGADGVKSVVARQLLDHTFKRDDYAIAMEAEFDRQAFSRIVDVPEIHYGVVNWGYAWVFPKSNKLTIGVAGLYRRNHNIKTVFNEFLQNDLKLDASVCKKGYYLPFGQFCKQPGRGNILLVGDAAGLVDPITGEGIAFAMQSGQFAAESIIQADRAKRADSAYAIYRSKLRAITGLIRQANLVKYLIYPGFSHQILLKGLATSTEKNTIRHYLDLLNDEINYRQYVGLVLRKSSKRILRLLVS